MKNTQVRYSSEEKSPTVSPTFSELLPPLPEEQMAMLEADILQNGCYSPIIVNEDLEIVDGHHRYRICKEHGLPYEMAVFSFADVLEAQQWALETQKSRRNLTVWELGQIALKLKPAIEKRAAENQGARTDLSATLPEGRVDTREELANAVGIGERTMGKIMQIDEHGPKAVKEALHQGKVSVNKGYEITREVKGLPEGEQETAAEQALAEAEYSKTARKIDSQASIAKTIVNAMQKPMEMEPTLDNVRIWMAYADITAENMADMLWKVDRAIEKLQELRQVMERCGGLEVVDGEDPEGSEGED